MMNLYSDLCNLAGREYVLREEPMSRHTTFQVGGPAEVYVTPDARSIGSVVRYCREAKVPYLVIGNGSNLLCGDGGVRGVVIEIGRRMAAIDVTGCRIQAEAGALLSAIATAAAQEALAGFEFAAGIPGSIGGAAVMNAGAYGGEMRDILTEVAVLAEDGEVRTVPAAELDLSYRHSAIPERGWLVLSVTLGLTKGRTVDIRARMEELKERRTSKQPLEYPSAGSTFQRPEGHFAGQLIEEAGLRGHRIGGAQVSEKHCGFIVNTGSATAADIRALMSYVEERVHATSGVWLEPEVRMVGDF